MSESKADVQVPFLTLTPPGLTISSPRADGTLATDSQVVGYYDTTTAFWFKSITCQLLDHGTQKVAKEFNETPAAVATPSASGKGVWYATLVDTTGLSTNGSQVYDIRARLTCVKISDGTTVNFPYETVTSIKLCAPPPPTMKVKIISPPHGTTYPALSEIPIIFEVAQGYESVHVRFVDQNGAPKYSSDNGGLTSTNCDDEKCLFNLEYRDAPTAPHCRLEVIAVFPTEVVSMSTGEITIT